jgi:hypothetical protein
MSSGAKSGKLGRGDGAFDLASYAPVAERITLFYETFPRGRIISELVSRTERDVVFRALVYRDASVARAAECGGDGEGVACAGVAPCRRRATSAGWRLCLRRRAPHARCA